MCARVILAMASRNSSMKECFDELVSHLSFDASKDEESKRY